VDITRYRRSAAYRFAARCLPSTTNAKVNSGTDVARRRSTVHTAWRRRPQGSASPSAPERRQSTHSNHTPHWDLLPTGLKINDKKMQRTSRTHDWNPKTQDRRKENCRPASCSGTFEPKISKTFSSKINAFFNICNLIGTKFNRWRVHLAETAECVFQYLPFWHTILATGCDYLLYTVSQKNDNDVLHYNFNAYQPIVIIFGRDIAEWICY